MLPLNSQNQMSHLYPHAIFPITAPEEVVELNIDRHINLKEMIMLYTM